MLISANSTYFCHLSQVDPDAKPVLNFGLSAVVYQWARGMSFKDITQLTAVQEGTIVRAITRLDELCRWVSLLC